MRHRGQRTQPDKAPARRAKPALQLVRAESPLHPTRARLRRIGLWSGGILAGLFVIYMFSGLVADRPLHGYMERKLNRSLKGYTAKLGAVDFHPIGFGLDLEKMTIVQDAQPDPPVLRIEEIHTRLHGAALLRLRLVGDCHIRRPAVHLDRRKAEIENRDDVRIQDRGWQDALQSVYPLRINRLEVENGEFTYLDREHTRPLTMRDVRIEATNIRNIRSRDRTYPSDVQFQAVVFDHGRLTGQGNADFLAKPHVGLKGKIDLTNVVLDYFQPILERQNLLVRKGALDAAGQIEYAPNVRTIDLEKLLLREPDLEYLHAEGGNTEKRQAQQVAAAARKIQAQRTLQLHVRDLRMENGRLSWTNRSTQPPYRLSINDTNLELRNLSTKFAAGVATSELAGRFMDSGNLTARAQFRPEGRGPDFDLQLRITNTPLTALNDLLRAHGRIDVVKGTFSLYSEMQVQNGRIRGYVKPLFRDVDVYDPKQDKGFFSKIWEAIVGAGTTLLTNQERDEVATVADLSGPIGDPDTSTWQIIGNLVKNAFVSAILPGFDREVKTKN